MTLHSSMPTEISDYKLINFNVPHYLIKSFDNLVRFKRVSRTSMLLSLMETYIREENQRLKDDRSLNSLINDIEEKNHQSLSNQLKKSINTVKEESEPPMIPHSSDDDWDEPLNEVEQWRREVWG